MWLRIKVSFSVFPPCFPIDFALGIFCVVYCELRRHGNAYRKEKHKHTIPGRAARFDVYIVGFVQTVRPGIAVKVFGQIEDRINTDDLNLCSLPYWQAHRINMDDLNLCSLPYWQAHRTRNKIPEKFYCVPADRKVCAASEPRTTI